MRPIERRVADMERQSSPRSLLACCRRAGESDEGAIRREMSEQGLTKRPDIVIWTAIMRPPNRRSETE